MVIVLMTANSTDHAHHQRYEEKDRAEHLHDLPVEGRKLAEVAHVQIQAVLPEERHQAGAGCREIFATAKLQHDAGGHVLAPAVDELLCEREWHRNEVVIELLDSLWLGAAYCELHHIGRSAGGRSQKVDLRIPIGTRPLVQAVTRRELCELVPRRRGLAGR